MFDIRALLPNGLRLSRGWRRGRHDRAAQDRGTPLVGAIPRISALVQETVDHAHHALKRPAAALTRGGRRVNAQPQAGITGGPLG